RGHFYNWYDTRDLRPLDPKYISSVDSGNLAGHLIALGNSCNEMIKRPLLDPHWLEGIEDTLLLFQKSLELYDNAVAIHSIARKRIEEELAKCFAVLRQHTEQPVDMAGKFERLTAQINILTDSVQKVMEEKHGEQHAQHSTELLFWMNAVQNSILSHDRDMELLKPWLQGAGIINQDPKRFPQDFLQRYAGTIPTLETISERYEEAILVLTSHLPLRDAESETLIGLFDQSRSAAIVLKRRLLTVQEHSKKLFAAMDFSFLFDQPRQLLSIGFRGSDGILDPNCYDLLASESRLASFIAIAKGDIPVQHWFHLGRSLTPVDRGSALISWSGSMFEYLMPLLVLREPTESLLGQTHRFIVRRQIGFGNERNVPWGISESAYNVRDLEFTYQYSTFGVPGLGLKRGLSKDIVIAPYATALAAMIEPNTAVENFNRLMNAGADGIYGLYEALDYTPTRHPDGEPVAVVRTYMAHHQGMTLVALDNVLHNGIMRTRFHTEPIVQATELLLQERTPRDVTVARPRSEEVNVDANIRDLIPSMHRRFTSPHGQIPRTHILSNGNYAVMMTTAGSGYSRWRNLSITRWREDVTCDSWGTYIYLRDVNSGAVWSAGFQPTCVDPDSYEVEFSEDKVEITRRDGSITTSLDVAVSPESDAEVRRISITNLGNRVREIDVTSYAEMVLNHPAAHVAHPSFSKLFVQTEYVADVCTLLATRRRRFPNEPEIWAAHLVTVEGESIGAVQYETDRARFLGRGRQIHSPISIVNSEPLSNTVGTVLDPVFSLRCRVRIPPGITVRVAFWTMVAPTRKEVLDLADKHDNANAFERAVTLAWTQAQVQLHHLGIGSEEAHLFQHLANHILYSNPELRPRSDALQRNQKGQSVLWEQRISGDLPIVLMRIDEPESLEIVKQLIRAHEYWRMKLLAVDLVILNEQPQSYIMDLQSAIETILRTNESQLKPKLERTAAQGSIFVMRAELVSMDVRMVLQSAARAVLLSRRGSLSEQLNAMEKFEPTPVRKYGKFSHNAKEWVKEKLVTLRTENNSGTTTLLSQPKEFSNGLGGFSDNGNEYVTVLENEQSTPAPWINVIANRIFGFQVSAEGGGYTWSLNSRENQLTSWSNDPVSDRPGEVFYVKDEVSGTVWSPTVLPIRKKSGRYTARHGQGYSSFEHTSDGIVLDLLQYVPLKDSIKISRLKINNRSKRNRRLAITAYVEWVLASSREASAPFIATEIDSVTGAMFAKNRWRTERQNRVAFADLAGRQTSWTGDRKEFLGRNGTLEHPAALFSTAPLSDRVGAGFDPCGALQTHIELAPDEVTEIIFFLGEAATNEEAQSLISRFRTINLDNVLTEVKTFWDNTLGTVQVKTPDRSMDILLNRWLLYQTLVCRMWARSAFYQAGGAYGFRDQLQDGMALVVSIPEVTR
ncbi:MAG: glucoamylase family protein, partial [Bacteroidota bacterium]